MSTRIFPEGRRHILSITSLPIRNRAARKAISTFALQCSHWIRIQTIPAKLEATQYGKIISLRFCVSAYLASQGAARRVASSASHLARRIRRNTSPRRKFARCQLQTLTATPVNQLTRSKTGVRVYWDTFPESEYGLNVLRNRLAFARNVDLMFAFFFPAIRSPMFANSI